MIETPKKPWETSEGKERIGILSRVRMAIVEAVDKSTNGEDRERLGRALDEIDDGLKLLGIDIND